MRRALAGLLGYLVFGCGAAAKPPVAQKALASEPEAPRAALHPYAELAAAAAPQAEANGVWIQLSSPASTWQKLPALVRGLPPLAVLKDLVEGHSAILPADVAAIVDPQQPVDFVFPLGLPSSSSPPTWAFRVRSAETIARGEAGLTLRRVASGVWDIGGVVPGEDEAEEETPGDAEEEGESEAEEREMVRLEPVRCRLVHLPPPVDYRVLCARGAAGLEENAAFLLSGRRMTQGHDDLHVELGGKAYAEVRAKGRAELMKPLDPSLTPSERTGRELASAGMLAVLDHDALALDLALGEREATARLDLLYGNNLASQVFSNWLDRSSHANLPAFIAPPVEGEQWFTFALGSAGEQLVRAIIEPAIAAFSEDVVWSKPSREELTHALYDILPRDGRFSITLGLDTAAALAALDADNVRIPDELDKPLSAAAVAELQAGMGGWAIVGLDVAPEAYLPALQHAYGLNNIKLKTSGAGNHAPKNPREAHTKTKLSPTPPGLPKGTLYFIDPTRPNPKYVPPADGSSPPELGYDTHLLVLPDHGHVWLVLARSQALAVKQARRLLARGVAREPQQRAAAAALMADVGMFRALGLDWDSKAQRDRARAALRRIERAPLHGQLPLPFSLEVLPQEGAGWRMRLSCKANLYDLIGESLAIAPDAP